MTEDHAKGIMRPKFDLRLPSPEGVREIAARVSVALGCSLTRTRLVYGVSEIYEQACLGMIVEVLAWPPWLENGVYTYTLRGYVEEDTAVGDFDQGVDLSEHVREALERAGYANWYIPSEEQLLRETDITERMESDA